MSLPDYLGIKGERGLVLRMAAIREIFQSARQFADETGDLQTILSYLETQHITYRAVAFEGASMSISGKDLYHSGKLTNWLVFLNEYAVHYRGHVHIGLGWTLARMREVNYSILNNIEPIYLWRVFDGWGYHNGLFKRKISDKPPAIHSGLEAAYDQGLGRSFWYDTKGNLDQIQQKLKDIDINRRPAMWTGLGIASTFVGGLNEDDTMALYEAAGVFRPKLMSGMAMVAKVRFEDKSLFEDIENCCKWIFKKTAEEVAEIITQAMPDNKDGVEHYNSWMSSMEAVFTG